MPHLPQSHAVMLCNYFTLRTDLCHKKCVFVKISRPSKKNMRDRPKVRHKDILRHKVSILRKFHTEKYKVT